VPEPFLVHRIDPVIGTFFGAHLWWYGLSYALGFLNAHVFLRRHRARLGLSLRQVYSLTLWLAAGVLIGGRGLVVFNHEWPFYREHLALIPAAWLGGLATHGLLAGGVAGVFMFCMVHRLPFRPVFDALAIPAALIMGVGRLGNFIDGQIVGRVTEVPWAVLFPDAEGFRHPVVLYDGLKNLLIIPVLVAVGRRDPPPGRLAAIFVLLYAGLRIPIDFFREYPLNPLGLPTGQGFNVIMMGVGVFLLIRNRLRQRHAPPGALWQAPAVGMTPGGAGRNESPGWRRAAFAAILGFSLLIPSDATRDIPRKYGHRHAGLEYTWMYPRITTIQP
jgi:phosphatidylglycerol:prolipoprotein diacylglycerol transferase